MVEEFRVFISAVSSEFRRLRSRIKRDLEARGLSVRVQDDFRQEALADTTLEKLHNYVRDCDAVVCIIGRRSGDKPPPAASAPFASMLPRGISEASFTQWEFFFARRHKRQLVKYIAEDDYFFADDGYAPERPAADAPDFPQLQKDFLHHVIDEQGADREYFRSADQLCRLIERQDWLAVPTSAWSLESTFEPFLKQRSESFRSREWLFDRIAAWRKNDGNSERLLFVTGRAGTGKSSVASRFVDTNPCGRVLAYHFCQTDEPSTLEPFRFVRNLVFMLTHTLPDYRKLIAQGRVQDELRGLDKSGASTEYFRKAVLKLLQGMEKPKDLGDGPGWIVIDALDEASNLTGGDNNETIIDVVKSGLDLVPIWLRVLATSRNGELPESFVNDGRGLAHELALDENAADDADLCRKIIDERLRAIDPPVPRAARSLLQRRSDGNLLWLKMVLDGITRGDYKAQDIKLLPPGLPDFYQHDFRRHYRDAAELRKIVKPLLATLVAAREPLSATSLSGATNISEIEIRRQLQRLAAYLRKHQNSYSIFHSSFSDWLLGQHGAHKYAISAADGDALLAEFCWRAFSGLPDRERDHGVNIVALEKRDATAYMVRHGITHCLAIGRVAQAVDLLRFVVRNWDEKKIGSSGFAAVSPARLTRTLLRGLDSCRDDKEKRKIDASHLACLIKDFYHVEPLGAPLDILIRHHPGTWRRATLRKLLDAGNFVLRFRISDKLADLCIERKGPIKMKDIYDYLKSDDVNVHELGAYALRRIYAEQPELIETEYLERLANSETYPALSALGDLLINLACQARSDGDRPRIRMHRLKAYVDRLKGTRFQESTWDHIRLDVWEVQAGLADGAELPPDADAGTRTAHKDLRDTEALRQQLLAAREIRINSAILDLVEKFFELGRYPDRIRAAEEELQAHARLDDVMQLLFRHPLWNVAETAASVLRSVAEHDEKGKAIVRALLGDRWIPGHPYWRVRFGAIETAYQLVDIEYRLFAERAVDKFHADPNSRVRALCAENLIAYILDRAARLRPDYLRRFAKPIARWLHDDDCWVLEHVFRLLTTLAHDGYDCAGLFETGMPPLLQGLGHTREDWERLRREEFLGHIEMRKRQLIPTDRAASS